MSSQRKAVAPSRDEITAQFSHELRNSLAAMHGALRLLQAESVSRVDQEKAHALMRRQLDLIARLVDDLLDGSRMHSGQLELRRTRVDLCTLLEHTIHASEFIMRQRQHRLTVSLPDTPMWLHGDATRLEQVFANLLINAAKYTDEGGEVEVSAQRVADEAVVRIRDTGIGIPPDVLPRVFDLYVRAGSSSQCDGLGLGLPLVRSLVESHGGRVSAISEPGRGSEFTVRLPLRP